MTKTPENVTSVQADKLRARLIDGESFYGPDAHTTRNHSADPTRHYRIWEQVRGQLDASATEDPRLTNQLRIRRRAVLSGKTAGKARHRFTLPQMAIATASSVALTLGIVSWIGGHPPAAPAPVSKAVQIASTDLANAIVSNVVDIDLDLTHNVDFYAWMGVQPDTLVEPPGKGT